MRRSASAARCLLVTDTLDTGGVDEVVAFLARSLPAHDFEVAVLLASDAETKGIGLIGRELAEAGVEVVDPGPEQGPDWVRSWRPDVMYLHGGMQWPVSVANDLGIPAAAVLHGMHDLFNLSDDEVAARSLKLSAVVAVSELVLEEYLHKAGDVHGTLAVTIPNGVDPAKVSRIDRRAARSALGLRDEILFVCLARHCLQKNTFALVSAFEDVAGSLPNAHLLVAGRVDEAVYTRQVIGLRDRSAAADRIHLRDNVQRVDVLLGAADVFVLDSYFEGWSLASMEALASGVPSVLSDVGGAREQLDVGVPNGLLVPNPLGDPIGLTWDAMLRARFRPQLNREALTGALCAVATGAIESSRAEIADASLQAFRADRSVAAHAGLLRTLLS
ncbi:MULTISPECIES: glycosyltransferase [Microbacterium]|uniref:glycosyltransferase n=1 Tax=Microbacterium TaxID=33882 RepID=UPI0013A56FB8|nr:glycosyltransferase [Microbacterium sp. KCTC 39802]